MARRGSDRARGAASRRGLDEQTLIRRYFLRRGAGRRDVVVGIGDDAAVTRLARGYDLVTATDALCEGVHFARGTPPRALGHRCLAVNLSDLAACGAEPLWTTLTLSMPAARGAWLREFSRGFFGLADRFDVSLIGGDTVRGPLGMSVTVLGRVRPGRFVPRDGARPGDGLYVTGHPGDAVAGRLLADAGRIGRGSAALRRRFLFPLPRVPEGAELAGIASAMLDVSDGLHDDARKLLSASGGGAELDAGLLPLSPGLIRFAGRNAARELALTGGDDYELLFTVPPAKEARLRRLVSRWSCAVTRLGTVTARRDVRWRLAGRPYVFSDRTFRHFVVTRAMTVVSGQLLKRVLRDPVHWIPFGLGAGLLPVAPGTWGSLLAAALFWLVPPLPAPVHVAAVTARIPGGSLAVRREREAPGRPRSSRHRLRRNCRDVGSPGRAAARAAVVGDGTASVPDSRRLETVADPGGRSQNRRRARHYAG